MTPPDDVTAYSRRLAAELRGLSPDMTGLYLHGSATLGGWHSTVSDVDVLVVLAGRPPAETRRVMAEAIAATIPACPGRGLELSVVSRDDSGRPRSPWPFLLHVAGVLGRQPTVVDGTDRTGDPDLCLHYAVCREAGWAVSGPPPTDVIGKIPRATVLRALADELDWGRRHGPVAYALLNACHALAFLHEGRLVAKTTGGRWALTRGVAPPASVTAALRTQAGQDSPIDITESDRMFLQDAARRLRAAADTE